MAWRRRRVLLGCLAAALLFLLYRLPEGKATLPDPSNRWMRALRGDKDAFLIKIDGSIGDWVSVRGREMYPVQTYMELPHSSREHPWPHIQHDFGHGFDPGAQLDRQQAVLNAFRHSWEGYKQFAWLDDELTPVSGGRKATFSSWAATLVDSLDTLWIMGLKDDFVDAVNAVSGIDFHTPDNVPINVFETNIRYLGGFLGAYDISNGSYPILLRKAVEVADMLLGAFDTYNRIPISHWHKKYGEKAEPETTIAELGSLSLEFTHLSQLTYDMKYYDAITRITDCLEAQQMSTRLPGLFPQTVSGRDCNMHRDFTFSLGAFADSFYEYLPKMHQLMHGGNPSYETMYLRSLAPITAHLLAKPMTPSSADILFPLTYKANQPHPASVPQMQHLACFAGGMFALGSRLFSRPADLDTARQLTQGCIWAYNATPTGIAPEQFHFLPCPSPQGPCPWNESAWKEALWQQNSLDASLADRKLPFDERVTMAVERTSCPKGMTGLGNKGYRLRPEAIESIFLLYRITGDESLRDDAWRMFQAIEKQTRAEFGYSTIDDVTLPAAVIGNDEGEVDKTTGRRRVHRKLDRMETFWTAETLKYFYLIFGDADVASLDEFVYNTEAHPFRLMATE